MKKSTGMPSNMFSVAPGVWGRKEVLVNFYIIQDLINDDWVLIDTGLKWSASHIKQMAGYLFGRGSLPKAIILTHGHFDHTGSVTRLAKEWNVDVYAHYLEFPYLTGQSDYPPADPTVGGGLMSAIAFSYPNGPINIRKYLKPLPDDGTITWLPEWKYLHTPGHSPGHISLFRESDRVLVAGDAFVTTKQESVVSVILQSKIISVPPKYFTCDWDSAKKSVAELVNLNPATVATGHGKPVRGIELQESLKELLENFDKKSIPATGRYVPNPAITNANGVMYIPPKKIRKSRFAIKAFGVAALVTFGLVWSIYKKKRKAIENDTLMEVEYNF